MTWEDLRPTRVGRHETIQHAPGSRSWCRDVLRVACALSHGVKTGHMSLGALVQLVDEEGLLSRADREAKIAAARDTEGDD